MVVSFLYGEFFRYLKFLVTAPPDAHTAARVRGTYCFVHSLPRGKERTNENRFRQAEIASLLIR
jgi:hypothetical protein